MAWPGIKPPVAILAGEQTAFVGKWQQLGWKIVVPEDLQMNGTQWFIELIQKNGGEG